MHDQMFCQVLRTKQACFYTHMETGMQALLMTAATPLRDKAVEDDGWTINPLTIWIKCIVPRRSSTNFSAKVLKARII